MHRIYCLAALLSLATTTHAQTSNDKQEDLLGQGTIHVGVNVGGGYGGYLGVVKRVVPRFQYFLKDGWSVSVEGRSETIGLRAQSIISPVNYLGAGLSTRYYFIRDRRLALFGQAGLTYGQSTFRRFDPLNPFSWSAMQKEHTRTWQASLGLGVHYRLSNRWSLEGVAEHTLTNFIDFNTTNYSRWQGSIGLNYRLGR